MSQYQRARIVRDLTAALSSPLLTFVPLKIEVFTDPQSVLVLDASGERYSGQLGFPAPVDSAVMYRKFFIGATEPTIKQLDDLQIRHQQLMKKATIIRVEGIAKTIALAVDESIVVLYQEI